MSSPHDPPPTPWGREPTGVGGPPPLGPPLGPPPSGPPPSGPPPGYPPYPGGYPPPFPGGGFPPPPPRKRTGLWIALGVVGLAVLVAVAVTVTLLVVNAGDSSPDESAGGDEGTNQTDPEPTDSGTEPRDELGVTIGPEDAPKQVVQYVDFLCPPCGQLHDQLDGQLAERAEAGEITLTIRPVIFLERVDDYTVAAANALFVVRDAAGEEVAFDFAERLLDQQPPESGPYPDDDWLVEQAVAAGAEEDAVRPGIEERAFANVVTEANVTAQGEGVSSVPAITIDGQPFDLASANPVPDLLAAIS